LVEAQAKPTNEEESEIVESTRKELAIAASLIGCSEVR
jgi:hypothetical protein